MNGNSYYIITIFIPCNTDSYYSVITIRAYKTCPYRLVVNIFTTINESISIMMILYPISQALDRPILQPIFQLAR
jgi:hypothetical protein